MAVGERSRDLVKEPSVRPGFSLFLKSRFIWLVYVCTDCIYVMCTACVSGAGRGQKVDFRSREIGSEEPCGCWCFSELGARFEFFLGEHVGGAT